MQKTEAKTRNARTFWFGTGSTNNRNAEASSVPILFSIPKRVKFGQQPVSPSVGVRYWARSPASSLQGWAFRAVTAYRIPAGG
jgi:hypothetical protein